MSSQNEQQKKLRGFFTREYYNLLNFVKSYWHGDEESDAEDILQDVMLNIFTKVDLDAPIENLLAYTYRSLKNKIIDRHRKRKQRLLNSFESEDYQLLSRLSDESPDAENQLEQEKMIASMFDLIGQLNPDQQEILIRTEIEEQTFESLSQEWKIPIGTLLSRKHRALSKLQKLFIEKNKI